MNINLLLLNIEFKLFVVYFYSEWENEKQNAKEAGKTPSLLRAILKTFGKGYFSLGIFAIVVVSYKET